MTFRYRIAERRDVTDMLRIYSPFILEGTTSFETVVPTETEFWQRVNNILQQTPWLVAEASGKVIGYAYAGPHRDRAAYRFTRELSVYINPTYAGRGVGSVLYEKVINLLRAQGYATVLAGVTLPNPASENFHRKFGFEPVGIYRRVGFKLGAFRDTSWWQMAIRTNPPTEIIAFPNLDIGVVNGILKK